MSDLAYLVDLEQRAGAAWVAMRTGRGRLSGDAHTERWARPLERAEVTLRATLEAHMANTPRHDAHPDRPWMSLKDIVGTVERAEAVIARPLGELDAADPPAEETPPF